MKRGKISTVLGLTQIVCVALMFTLGHDAVALDMLLVLVTSLLIILAVTFASLSFWRKEQPIAWAIAGLAISLFWALWVLIAPTVTAF